MYLNNCAFCNDTVFDKVAYFSLKKFLPKMLLQDVAEFPDADVWDYVLKINKKKKQRPKASQALTLYLVK